MRSRYLRFVSTTIVAATVSSAAAGQSGLTAPERAAGWRSDIDTLVAVARRVHAGPARPAHSAPFSHAAAELRRRVPMLTDRRVVVEMQRLLAMLGDGHSLVYVMPSRLVSFEMLPVEVYQFEDGLYVVGGTGEGEALVGSRVESFGGIPTAEVLRRMEPYVSRDNAMAFKAFASLYLVTPAFLEAWGATADPTRVSLGIVDRQGRRRIAELSATQVRRTRRRLFPPPGASAPIPPYLREAERPYGLTTSREQRAVYLQFNQVTDAPGQPLAALATVVRDSLRATGADRLIVDVRHNNGGNNLLLAPLIDVLASFAESPDRRIYVITSRATFSAAQNFINRLERRVPRTIFAGEPSMSSPNFTGEDNGVELPFSGVMVSISNRHWQDSSPDDRRPWIAPQIPVALTGADWLANRDPVLAAVLEDLRRPR
jgi:hypothetical protein